MFLLVLALLLWVVVSSKTKAKQASAVIQPKETTDFHKKQNLISYPCPKTCDCFLKQNPVRVDVACNVDTLRDGDMFTMLNQTHSPSTLSLRCNNLDVRASRLVDGIFESLHAFYSIEVKDCHVTDVSKEAFRGLTSLKTLVIEGGRNTQFDVDCLQLPELSNLETLSITETGTSRAPNLCNHDSLWCVNMSRNSINVFLDTGMICDNPTQLEDIDISDNYIKDLPQRLANVSFKVARLSAARNKISSLESTVFEGLTEMLIVNLNDNLLASLPSDFLVGNTKLRTLEIGHNKIGKLPEKMLSTLRDLTFLRLDGMQLECNVWKELKCLTKLQLLYLNNNVIESFALEVLQKLINLLFIDISGNKLRKIPNGAFESQDAMMFINISSNNIDSIEKDSFKGLPMLINLDLKENQIKNVHKEALSHLLSLQILNMSSNEIEILPTFPSSLIILDLRRNHIAGIDNTSFANISGLQGINLMSNWISYIPHKTFQTNSNFTFLDLAYNNIRDIDLDAFGTKSYLETLILHHNRIYELAFLRYTDFTSLKIIDLGHNRIRALASSLFPEKIEEIFLDNNDIQSIGGYTFKQSSKLRYVNLRMNLISTLSNIDLDVASGNLLQVNYLLAGNPFNCDCHLAWLKQLSDLQNTYSQGAFIIRDRNSIYCTTISSFRDGFEAGGLMKNIPATSFLCEYKEHCFLCPCCEADVCSCYHVCPENCTCYNSNDWNSNVIDCFTAGLTAVPLRISVRATLLDLSGNFLQRIVPGNFDDLSVLRKLYLNSSHVCEIRAGSFKHLSSLTDLDVSNNLLQVLVPEMLEGLNNLKILNLRNNKISLIAEHAFDSFNALENLDLAGNELQILSGYEFKRMSKIPQIKLANNPWSCKCDYLEDMKQFTLANADHIVDFEDVACTAFNFSTEELEKYPLADLQLPEFCRNETVIFNHTRLETIKEKLDKIAISVTVSVLSIFVLGMFLFGLAFWKRDFLKVWCFLKFGWKFRTHEDDNDEDRMYDAFVSYSSNDEEFILRELVPHLEDNKDGRQCYKLCVHYRDFAVGASIAESILSAVKSSRRVIIILSENFLSSEWCQYEFQTAHYQLLKERKNRIIMILLHDIEPDMLDQQLKDYLKTRTYVKYGDPWFWPKIEYAMPDRRLAQDLPVDNVFEPDAIPEHRHNERIREGSVNSDMSDNMQYILDNMRNFEADDNDDDDDDDNPQINGVEVELEM